MHLISLLASCALTSSQNLSQKKSSQMPNHIFGMQATKKSGIICNAQPRSNYLNHKKRLKTLERGWIELALINKKYSANTQLLSQVLIRWRREYSAYPADQLMPDNKLLTQLENDRSIKQVAILVPQHGQFDTAAQNIREDL